MALKERIDPYFSMDTSLANQQAVFAYAVHAENPSYLIESDFLNTSGMNIGWGLMDRALRALSPELLYACKPKGDEGSFIVSGNITEGQVVEALTRTRADFDEFLAEAGILNLAHGRGTDVRNAGTGNVVAFAQVNGVNEHALKEAVDILHKDIYAQKQEMPAPNSNDVVHIPHFATNTYANIVNTALKNPRWTDIRPGPNLIPDSINAGEKAGHIIGITQARLERRAALNALEEPRMLMRMDIQGLHNLNSIIGMDRADTLIDDMYARVREIVRQTDPQAQFFEFDSRQMDILVDADEEHVQQIKRLIYSEIQESGLFTNLASDIPAVPLTMAHTQIESGTPVPLALEHVGSALSLYKMHSVSFFDRHKDAIFAIPHTPEDDIRQVEDLDHDGPGSVPFALSTAVLLSKEQMQECLKLPFGLLAQRLYGFDMTQTITRQQRFKDLIENGAVTEDEVLARLEEPLEHFDAWLDDHAAAREENFKMEAVVKRQIFNHEEFMTMSLGRRWMPQINTVTAEDFDAVLNMTMQAQACSRNMDDIAKSSSDFANNPEIYKDLLLEDIRTHIADTTDPVTRKIQGAGQALRAIHFMRGIRGMDLTDSERNAALQIVKETYDSVSGGFASLGKPYSNIGVLLSALSADIQTYENALDPAYVLQKTLGEEIGKTRPYISNAALHKFDFNMRALDMALTPFAGRYKPAHSYHLSDVPMQANA